MWIFSLWMRIVTTRLYRTSFATLEFYVLIYVNYTTLFMQMISINIESFCSLDCG